MIKVIMHGCNGKMGKTIAGLIAADEEIERLEKEKMKNENTVKTATIVNCICLLVEGIIYSIISIMVWLNKIEITSFETFLLIISIVILPLPFIFIVHFIRFDKNGNLRRNK